MKNFVLTALTCVFALTLSNAQDNAIKLQQISDQNRATIEQVGKSDEVDVLQTGGNNNVASIRQIAGNLPGTMDSKQDFTLEQNGSNNRLTAVSRGLDNDVFAYQIGHQNRATFDIRNNSKDQGAIAKLYQQGRNNVANIDMEGRRNTLTADQIGRENRITLRMGGGSAAHNATLRQEGNHNRMDVQQLGSSHDVSALQVGNHNVAILKQSNK